MNIRSLLDDLSSKLSILERKVQLENKIADFSLNTHLENLYIKILNEVYGYNLINVNKIKTNFAGIDALDANTKIAVQITSTFSKKKIENTIDKIISNDLTDHIDILQFYFLTPKKELTKASEDIINKKVNGKFKLNLEKGLMDGKSIFQELYFENDIEKIKTIVKLIDDFINLNSENKIDGIDGVIVIFDKIDIKETYFVVDAFLKNLINVYIESEKLYNKFKNKKHKLLDYLILVGGDANVNHLNYTIVILSNPFIKDNLKIDKKIGSILLKKTIDNNNRVFIVSFDPLLKTNIISNENKEFRTFQTLPNERKKIGQFINDKIVKQIITSQTDESYTTKDIIYELKSSYHNFNSTELSIENTNFNCLKFEMENFQNIKLFYLILNKNYILKQAQIKFKELIIKHKINLKNLTILVPKDFRQKTRRRIELVKNTFKESKDKVYFIDEYLYDKRFKSYPKQKLLAISDFVDPIIKTDNNTKGLNDIMHWVTEVSNSPIAIISAPGGVGKTTLCEKIHDRIITDYERCIVIFIDPDNFLQIIQKMQLNEDYNIYSLYKSCAINTEYINDEQAFLLNYKLGNIVMIFDGIDETISTVQDFTLKKFVEKLMTLEQKIGKGKIIINCRDNYIEDLRHLYKKTVKQIQFYDLLPFNKSLAEEYFKNHFKDEPRKVKKCFTLLNEFVLSKELDNDEYLYPPFVLEIIRQVVKEEFYYNTKDLTFISDFLVEKDIIDYIFYKTCNREITKKDGQGFVLDVDNQVSFMIKLAVEEKGQIKKDDIKRLLIENDRSEDFAMGIVDHPFLLNINEHYEFRFSFLQNHFKAIHLFKLIKNDETPNISDFDIRMLAHELIYNSLVFKGVINKVKKDIERDYVYNIKEIISIIINKNDVFSEITKRTISNLFILIIELSKLFKTDNLADINIVQKVFGTENNEIQNFYLYDVPKDMDLVLNFNDLYFSNSQIMDFSNFFNCLFNDNTFFDDTCNISKVYDTNLNFKSILATQKYFDKNIKGDNSISKVLMLKSKPDKIIMDSLKAFLKCFYEGRNLKFHKSKKEIASQYKQKIKFEIILEEFSNCGLIDIENDKITVDKNYHRKINKFIFEGLNFSTLNDAIHGIIERQN